MSHAVLEYSKLRSDPPWAYRSLSLVVPAFNFGLLVLLSALECSLTTKWTAWVLLSAIGILLAVFGLQKSGNKFRSVMGLLANLIALGLTAIPYLMNQLSAL